MQIQFDVFAVHIQPRAGLLMAKTKPPGCARFDLSQKIALADKPIPEDETRSAGTG